MKIKFIAATIYTAIVAVISILFYNWLFDDPGTITQGKIEYNKLEKDPYTMPLKKLQADAECFYKAVPYVGIQNISGDDYEITASLCEREWRRKATIRSRDSPKHFFVPGISVKSGLTTGISARYYQLITDNFGIGGGGACFRDKDYQIDIATMFAW